VVMRLDMDSFFLTFGRLVSLDPDGSTTCPGRRRTPCPFSVNLHSPVEFHLLHLLDISTAIGAFHRAPWIKDPFNVLTLTKTNVHSSSSIASRNRFQQRQQ
jgi:hypothetical protein